MLYRGLTLLVVEGGALDRAETPSVDFGPVQGWVNE